MEGKVESFGSEGCRFGPFRPIDSAKAAFKLNSSVLAGEYRAAVDGMIQQVARKVFTSNGDRET